ncbi:MAG: hypothetical protein ACRD6X_17530 [Pyrinomonadaceae bacterium]
MQMRHLPCDCYVKHGYVIILLLLLLMFKGSQQPAVFAQRPNEARTSIDWILFTPQDGSFTIELPRIPTRSNALEKYPDTTAYKQFFECTRDVDLYEIKTDEESSESKFQLGVFDVSGCKREKKLFSKEIARLYLIIGGDAREVVKESKKSVNGFPAREIFYITGSNRGRAIAVDASKHIFLLIYDQDDDLTKPSIEEDRIFRTFRPNK